MTPADLLAIRHELGMSQVRLAAALGVQPLAINRWERGKHPIPPYLSLALETIRRNAMETKPETRYYDMGDAAVFLAKLPDGSVFAAIADLNQQTVTINTAAHVTRFYDSSDAFEGDETPGQLLYHGAELATWADCPADVREAGGNGSLPNSRRRPNSSQPSSRHHDTARERRAPPQNGE